MRKPQPYTDYAQACRKALKDPAQVQMLSEALLRDEAEASKEVFTFGNGSEVVIREADCHNREDYLRSIIRAMQGEAIKWRDKWDKASDELNVCLNHKAQDERRLEALYQMLEPLGGIHAVDEALGMIQYWEESGE